MTEPQEFIAPATASQPQRFVIGLGDDLDELQGSDAWIATDTPVEPPR